MKELYKEILERFTTNEFGDWKRYLFNLGTDKTAASDGHFLVICPKIGDYQDKTATCIHFYPIEQNTLVSYLTDKVESELIKSAKTKSVPCDACYKGHVEFNFHHKGKDYPLTGECPVCDGHGSTVNYGTVQIGNSCFDERKIAEILRVAKDLNEQEILLIKQTVPSAPSFFIVGEFEIIFELITEQTIRL